MVAALTDPHSKIPPQFTLQQVVAAIDPIAYDKTFKHGKMAVTIPESVYFHLKELVKLGHLQHVDAEDGEAEVSLPKTLGFARAVVQPTQLLTQWSQWEPAGLPFVLDADRNQMESPRSSKSVVTFTGWPEAIAAPQFRSARRH